MKNFLTVLFGVAAVILAIALVVTKSNDNSQLSVASASLAECTNRLDEFVVKIGARETTISALSNHVAVLTVVTLENSNRLEQAQVALADRNRETTNLAAQVEQLTASKDTMARELGVASNELTAVSVRLAAVESSLIVTNEALIKLQRDYATLGERLKQDVAERLVVERKFQNPSAIQEQLVALKKSPAGEITSDRIYAGLNVLVTSNGAVRILSPD